MVFETVSLVFSRNRQQWADTWFGAPPCPSKKFFFTCHKSALPVDIPYRRTSAGAEEKGGHAMTGRKKRSLLPVVGLVAVAAAALLFLGVWTQASRAENWAQEPSQVPLALACPDFA